MICRACRGWPKGELADASDVALWTRDATYGDEWWQELTTRIYAVVDSGELPAEQTHTEAVWLLMRTGHYYGLNIRSEYATQERVGKARHADLVIFDGEHDCRAHASHVIEYKKDLRTPTPLRKGVEQVQRYADDIGSKPVPILCAPGVRRQHIDGVLVAPPGDVIQLMRFLSVLGLDVAA